MITGETIDQLERGLMKSLDQFGMSINADYSRASIEHLDKIRNELWGTDGPSETFKLQMSLMWASYFSKSVMSGYLTRWANADADGNQYELPLSLFKHGTKARGEQLMAMAVQGFVAGHPMLDLYDYFIQKIEDEGYERLL